MPPPLHTVTSYMNRQWRDSSTLSYLDSFHRAAWEKSWASPGQAALKAAHNYLSWSDKWRPHFQGNNYSPQHVWVLAVYPGVPMWRMPESLHSSLLPGGHSAFNGISLWHRGVGYFSCFWDIVDLLIPSFFTYFFFYLSLPCSIQLINPDLLCQDFS